jgi:outer membrane murein-binding lipoprotein Lpp
MSIEMVLVGIILFSAMIAGGVKIWLTKRKEEKLDEFDSDVEYESSA